MEFELFSKTHLIYLFGYSLIFVPLYWIIKISSNPRKIFQVISFIALGLKFTETFINYFLIGESWKNLLPLHLCNITLLFFVIGVLFNFYRPFLHAAFFWSIGAIFALVTPEVKVPFPNFFNISFFLTHCYIIFAAVVEYKIFKLKPTFLTWLSSLMAINLISLSVYLINALLGTNYLYINRLPDFNSPLNYLGRWPYYLISIEFIYIVLTFGMLLLFGRKKASNF